MKTKVYNIDSGWGYIETTELKGVVRVVFNKMIHYIPKDKVDTTLSSTEYDKDGKGFTKIEL